MSLSFETCPRENNLLQVEGTRDWGLLAKFDGKYWEMNSSHTFHFGKLKVAAKKKARKFLVLMQKFPLFFFKGHFFDVWPQNKASKSTLKWPERTRTQQWCQANVSFAYIKASQGPYLLGSKHQTLLLLEDFHED